MKGRSEKEMKGRRDQKNGGQGLQNSDEERKIEGKSENEGGGVEMR